MPAPSILLVSSLDSQLSVEVALARLRALLEAGWDAHVAFDGAEALAAADGLAGAEFAGRVHLSAAHMSPGPAARVRMPVGVARALAGSPRDVGGQLLAGVTPRAATLLGREVAAVLFTLRPDVVHFNSVAAADPRLAAARTARAAVVAGVEEIDLEPGAIDRTRRVAATAAGLHFVSEALQARGAELGRRPADAVIDAWGIDARALAMGRAQRTPRGDRPLRVLTVSPLTWRGGHEWALGAIRAAIDAGVDLRYRIAGEGEHSAATWFARHDLGLLEEVEIVGDEALEEHLRWADVYLDASVTAGAGGRTVSAMAAGIPVIATERTDRPRGTDAGCRLVSARDQAALAKELTSLAADAELMSALGEASRAAVATPPGRQEATSAFVQMCRDALETPGGA